MQSGSIHVPPTGSHWPAATRSRMRAQSPGARSRIHAYCWACEQAKRYVGVALHQPQLGGERAHALAERLLERPQPRRVDVRVADGGDLVRPGRVAPLAAAGRGSRAPRGHVARSSASHALQKRLSSRSSSPRHASSAPGSSISADQHVEVAARAPTPRGRSAPARSAPGETAGRAAAAADWGCGLSSDHPKSPLQAISTRALSASPAAARAASMASARTYAPPLTSPCTGSPSSHSVASELVTSSRSTCSPSHSAGHAPLHREPPRRPQRAERHPRRRVAVVQRRGLGSRDAAHGPRDPHAVGRPRVGVHERPREPRDLAHALARVVRVGEQDRHAAMSSRRDRLRPHRKTTTSEGTDQDADPRPHEHERRRLRDDTERLAGADRGPGLRLGREPWHPRVPRGLRGGADGPHDVRAGPQQRPLAVAHPERVRARLGPPARDARPRRHRQRPGAAAGEDPRRQPGPRRPPRRRPAHDRGLPRPRSTRQARAGRAAAAPRRRDAADAVAQPRPRA